MDHVAPNKTPFHVEDHIFPQFCLIVWYFVQIMLQPPRLLNQSDLSHYLSHNMPYPVATEKTDVLASDRWGIGGILLIATGKM